VRWILALVIALVVGGCGSPSEPSPTAAGPAGPPATGVCAAIPTIDPNNPPASLPLTRDLTLESKFPTQLDGQPVTGLASGRWIETLCMTGGEASVDAASQALPAGVSLSQVSVASANADVDGNSVTIVAFRVPGGSGSQLLAEVGALSAAIASGEPKFSSTPTTVTAGGKSVSVFTNPADGSNTYLYAGGDTLWLVDSLDQSQADKIFAALP